MIVSSVSAFLSATLHSPALFLYIMAASLLLCFALDIHVCTTSIELTNDVCRLSVARELIIVRKTLTTATLTRQLYMTQRILCNAALYVSHTCHPNGIYHLKSGSRRLRARPHLQRHAWISAVRLKVSNFKKRRHSCTCPFSSHPTLSKYRRS